MTFGWMLYDQSWAFKRNDWLPIIHEELVRYASLAIKHIIILHTKKMSLIGLNKRQLFIIYLFRSLLHLLLTCSSLSWYSSHTFILDGVIINFMIYFFKILQSWQQREINYIVVNLDVFFRDFQSKIMIMIFILLITNELLNIFFKN